MSESLAIKYRPKTFEDVVEQSITTKILNRIIETGSIKNCYLFAGDSGCGKTTLARCFARAINKGVGEPIEIDAASNNGVDNVRAIIEDANQRSLTGTYKIFIIDECHAITSAGWQAFLKGIEEPPAYTIFMFCTTEPNKIPVTILNRVQRYNICKITTEGIKSRLEYICEQEGFTNYEQTCDLISKISEGCMRDAIMYLDQCSTYSHDLSLTNTKPILGDFSYETMFKLTWAIQKKDEGKLLSIVDNMYNTGRDLKHFIDLYLSFILDLNKYMLFKDINMTNIPEYLATEQNSVTQFTVGQEGALDLFHKLEDLLMQAKTAIRYDTSYKSTIEMYLLMACR